MSLAPPPPLKKGSVRRLVSDIRSERNAVATAPLPPGLLDFDMRRTRRFAEEPLSVLIPAYQQFGPVFSLRILHQTVVWMIGPAANHFVTVAGADHFHWREGHFADLIPFLGDGLLTIDGDFHRRSRRIMLPAFHRERIAASLDTMLPEIEAAVAPLRDGQHLDLYGWTRELALRVAMRALFGLDPDGRLARETDAATQFEEALGFHAADYLLQMLRGPRTPWARMQAAKQRLDALLYDEIAGRRRTGERGPDILSMLLDAADEDGNTLSDRHVRDEVTTLLFAGHDTTTSTIAFLFYELARHPHELELLLAERDEVLGDRDPTFAELMGGALPRLDLVLDETLRLYPAAWVGPRRAVKAFEFEGVRVPADFPVNYSSWASHHLPDVWGDPEAFRPERFLPDERAKLPKGAYVPFGGGSRTCIGMRFGQLEIKAIVSRILRDFTLDLQGGFQLRIRQMPTIGPRRTVKPYEFAGVQVPANFNVNYSSWASHHLPDVWGDPEAFRPDRFAPEARAQLPKGAYVPFGGGSRTCIGMRFGQLEIKSIVTRILRDFTLDLQGGFQLRIRQMPTIGPRDGMPVIVRAR